MNSSIFNNLGFMPTFHTVFCFVYDTAMLGGDS